ncbi:MAG: hypothetical protein V1824_04055 [archaeon]
MINEYNFLIKFPYLKKAKKLVDIDLFSIESEVIERAKKFILNNLFETSNDSKNNLIKREDEWKKVSKLNDSRIAISYIKIFPISKIILSLIDYSPLTSEFANYYFSQTKFYLSSATDEELDEVINDICPKINFDNNYYLSLVDYLSLDLGEDHKLQYSNLKEGNIYFDKSEIIDLISLILKKNITQSVDIDIKEFIKNKKEFPKDFQKAADEIKTVVLDSNKNKITYAVYRPKDDSMPPCFMKLYNEILSGQKLSHMANYSLAVFLANIYFSYEEVLQVFRKAPNFDEKIASYQIKKIFEKKYSVSNCNTLRSNNLCVADCKVNHPLQLLKKRVDNYEDKKEN